MVAPNFKIPFRLDTHSPQETQIGLKLSYVGFMYVTVFVSIFSRYDPKEQVNHIFLPAEKIASVLKQKKLLKNAGMLRRSWI